MEMAQSLHFFACTIYEYRGREVTPETDTDIVTSHINILVLDMINIVTSDINILVLNMIKLTDS